MPQVGSTTSTPAQQLAPAEFHGKPPKPPRAISIGAASAEQSDEMTAAQTLMDFCWKNDSD